MLQTIKYDNPPQSRMPMVVQTALYGMATVPFLKSCHRRFGDTFTVRLPGGRAMVVFADPADIKAVFALDADDFSAESGADLLGPFVGERSVLLMDGAHHKQERARLVRSLHGESTTLWEAAIARAARAELTTWPVGRAVRRAPTPAIDRARGDPGHGVRHAGRGVAARPR